MAGGSLAGRWDAITRSASRALLLVRLPKFLRDQIENVDCKGIGHTSDAFNCRVHDPFGFPFLDRALSDQGFRRQ